jgi:hypothetical protein
VIVRNGTPDDIDWVIDQAWEFCEFFGSRYSLFNEEYLREYVPELMEKHVFLVACDHDGTRMGFLAAMRVTHLLNPLISTLSEVAWWVAEQFRGSRAGTYLLLKYVGIGRDTAKWVTMSLEANSPVKPEALERLGFRLQERSYILEV